MSNGEDREVSVEYLQLVQNLIERCLQLYMTRKEVVNKLFHQAKIEHAFTDIVWQKLEAQNQEFFRAYHMRLKLKAQISRFNKLLERHVELMHQMSRNRVVPTPLSNGSQSLSRNNYLAYPGREPNVQSIMPDNVHHTISAMPNVYANGMSPMQHMQVGVSMPLAQSSNAGLVQGFSGRTINTDSGYGGNSPITFDAHNNILQPHNVIGEASINYFGGGESSSQPFRGTVLEPDMNSYEPLVQMTRNFSLRDLTADFSNRNDILEGYSGSPFMGRDANLMDPNVTGDEQDNGTSDTMSEGFSYQGFGSE